MDVGAFKEFAADGFAGAAFEEDVVGQYHRGAAVDLEDGMDVLEEVQLFVAGRRPEIVAVDGEAFLGLFAVGANHGHAALFAEGRIGQDHIVLAMFRGERVFGRYGQVVGL